MHHSYVSVAILATVTLVAVFHDIRFRKIPNWILVAGLCAHLSSEALTGQGLTGIDKSLLGLLVGLAIMVPLYLLRTMGAGDAKYIAFVGAVLGPYEIPGVVLLTFVIGGLLSLIAAIASNSLHRVLCNIRLMGLFVIAGREAGFKISDVQTTGRLPYAIAIALGTAAQLWLSTSGDWLFT